MVGEEVKNIQRGMNVRRQRRKIIQLIEAAPDDEHAVYLSHLLTMFDDAVGAGLPRPAGDFIPMYHEEFDIHPDIG
jgi:hypothetical protein